MLSNDGFVACLAVIACLWPIILEYLIPRLQRSEEERLRKTVLSDLETLLDSLPPTSRAQIEQSLRSQVLRWPPLVLWQLTLVSIPVPIITALRPMIQDRYALPSFVPAVMWGAVICLLGTLFWSAKHADDVQLIHAPPEGRKTLLPEEVGTRSTLVATRHKRMRSLVLGISLLPAFEAVAYAVFTK